jgi:predicted PhzF superfamily epimerase YddE/YHI9
MQLELPVELQISQGELVGRPSTLHLQVSAAREILVGGDVIELGRGTLNLG